MNIKIETFYQGGTEYINKINLVCTPSETLTICQALDRMERDMEVHATTRRAAEALKKEIHSSSKFLKINGKFVKRKTKEKPEDDLMAKLP